MTTNKWLFLTLLAVAACGDKNAQTSPPLQEETTTLASFEPLSPAQRLRKLSFHLRGITPTNREYGERGEGPEYFARKTREYLASPEHIGKMNDRLDELFRFKVAARRSEQGGDSEASGRSAADTLFREIARQNLSWDHLLSARTYEVAKDSIDLTFFSALAPAISPIGTDKFQYAFLPDDPRLAGAVTSGRFFGRYNTTNVNRNRGRAAALFRIFLCDDMRAVVETKAGEEEELLKKAFPAPTDWHAGYVHTREDQDIDKHTNDPSCFACHYKLDPMGKTFITSSVVLSDEAAPGALVFRRASGELVNRSVAGLGELAQVILAQPEYARCQVSHFWKWFIRGDEPPSSARLEELTRDFDRLGHRTNDFIAYLVNQPEFYQAPAQANRVTFLSVKSLLDRCTSCHAGFSQTIPSFSRLPIGGKVGHPHWLDRIAQRLDLAHDGAGKSMPPAVSAWQPTLEDLRRIRRWIDLGAPDEGGIATLDGVAAAPAEKPKVTFHDSYQRYVGGHDVLRLLQQKFPEGDWKNEECASLTTANRAALGDASPFNGERTYRGPSGTYVKWYAKCLKWQIEIDYYVAKKQGMARLLGDEIPARLVGEETKLLSDPDNLAWIELRPEIRTEIIRRLVDNLFGVGMVPERDEWVERLGPSLRGLSAMEAMKRATFFLGMRDEFLTY